MRSQIARCLDKLRGAYPGPVLGPRVCTSEGLRRRCAGIRPGPVRADRMFSNQEPCCRAAGADVPKARGRRLFETTNTDESIMSTPAIIGFSRPATSWLSDARAGCPSPYCFLTLPFTLLVRSLSMTPVGSGSVRPRLVTASRSIRT